MEHPAAEATTPLITVKSSEETVKEVGKSTAAAIGLVWLWTQTARKTTAEAPMRQATQVPQKITPPKAIPRIINSSKNKKTLRSGRSTSISLSLQIERFLSLIT